MAKLAEYGVLDYDQMTDYETYTDTIDTLLAVLSFPVIEEKINDDGIIISLFEKSFWGKKPKGYLSLKYIEDAQLDITKNNIEDSIAKIAEFNEEYYAEDEPIHEFSKILICIDAQIHNLSRPRKRVISYGFLMHNVNLKYNAIGQLHLEEMQNGFNSAKERYLSGQADIIHNLNQRLEVFKKYN
jgi:hypothetical protein